MLLFRGLSEAIAQNIDSGRIHPMTAGHATPQAKTGLGLCSPVSAQKTVPMRNGKPDFRTNIGIQ